MKAILLLVLLATGLATESFLSTSQDIKELELSESHFQNFLIGYALGIGLLDAIPDALGCVGTVTGFKDLFQKAIEDLKTNDLEHIVEGVQIFAKLFDGVASDCGDTAIEVVTSYKNIMAIIRAKGFIKQGWINIGKNLETVVDDIQQFFFLGDDDWMLKGAYIGDIVKIYVTGIPNDK
ncbi:unnamed protein product [Paramecium pentaurelia]|uniref:Uncharacterized protein n=1 Tax=Paramecium pentaurelia TaxID=43138 RepID=A0A8S1T0Z9_9CILI|nr:unnamed protein product [Paramecium pentaurelia]